MSDDPIRDLADQLLDVMEEAERNGTEPRHIIMALDDARRQWMLENMEKLVLAPPAED